MEIIAEVSGARVAAGFEMTLIREDPRESGEKRQWYPDYWFSAVFLYFLNEFQELLTSLSSRTALYVIRLMLENRSWYKI